jgi:phosphopantothenoylcysteine decarboxylase/phosphopantothenate--cysteine ligase
MELPENERYGGFLTGKKVLVGVTASISVYRVPDIIRGLRKEGADVKVAASPEALEFVGKKVFQWASENPVIDDISGMVEHVREFEGDPQNTALAIIPATYNFIGKAASGMADDPPSLFFSFAHGNGNHVVISPTMHEAMMYNPAIQKNMEFLQTNGVEVIPPRNEEGKAKIEENETVIDWVCRAAGPYILRGKTVLILGGNSSEPVDSVRSITNGSTGLTAIWIAKNAFRLGAEKVVYIGNSSFSIPSYVHHIPAHSTEEFESKGIESLGIYHPDIILVPASLSDFRNTSPVKGKLDSSNEISIKLEPREKIINRIRKKTRAVLIGFKLSASRESDEKKISNLLGNCDFLVVNELNGNRAPFGSGNVMYTVYGGHEPVRAEMGKPELSQMILEMASMKMEEKEYAGHNDSV